MWNNGIHKLVYTLRCSKNTISFQGYDIDCTEEDSVHKMFDGNTDKLFVCNHTWLYDGKTIFIIKQGTEKENLNIRDAVFYMNSPKKAQIQQQLFKYMMPGDVFINTVEKYAETYLTPKLVKIVFSKGKELLRLEECDTFRVFGVNRFGEVKGYWNNEEKLSLLNKAGHYVFSNKSKDKGGTKTNEL